MRKTFKWICGIILTPILLFTIFAVLIYIPPVQDWLVKHVTEYASEKTGMSITVDKVRLVFPLDLGVEGFRMTQQNGSMLQIKDTVADVRRLVVDIRLWPLFKKNVEIDAIEFSDLKLNTADFVHETRIKGSIGRLYLSSHGIDIGQGTIKVDEALLKDAAVNVELSDTVPPDTSESKNYWKISVEKLDVANTCVTVHMPGDTLQIEAYFGNTKVRGGYFDLYEGLYEVMSLDWTGGRLNYDDNFAARTKGLDYNHIAISDLNIGIDSFFYCSPKLEMSLRACSFMEKSGISVSRLAGPVALDSAKIHLPDIDLATPNSKITASVIMDLDAFSDINPGKIYLTADAGLGKQDLMLFIGDMPTAFIRQWPNYPLTIKTVLTGNLKYLKFAGLNVKLPTAFNINASGYAADLAVQDNMKADFNLDAQAYNLGFVSALINDGDTGGGINIPYGIGLNGKFSIDGKHYLADFMANEGDGKVKAKASFNTGSMSYTASMGVDRLHLEHFLPGSGLGDFTGEMTVKGMGTDFFSFFTKLQASANIHKFSYGQYNLDSISFKANVKNGRIHAGMYSDNPLVNGTAVVDALMSRKEIRSTFVLDLKNADWHGLQLVKSPLSTSLCCHVDFVTDLKEKLMLQGGFSDIAVIDSNKNFRPDDINIDLFTSQDTTHLVAECGDFNVRFNGRGGYRQILEQGARFTDELFAGLKNKNINLWELRNKLPQADFYLTTGKENTLGRFITHAGYTFRDAMIDMSSSPATGLNGSMQLLELQNSSVKLDTIRFNIVSDSAQCKYFAQVRNSRSNRQYVFNALLDGYVFDKGSSANVRFYDTRDSLGLKLGFEALMGKTGVRLHMLTDDPILGYKKFHVNEDNFILMETDHRISANLLLSAGDGMGIHVYTDDSNEEALQDLTVGLNKFDLSEILSAIPYMPHITGIMNGDFHLIQTKDEMSISSAVSVDNMTYENSRIGNISTELVYMPKSDGTQGIDGILMCNGEQVADVSGAYKPEGDGELDVQMNMTHLPMHLFNGFMPDKIIQFVGYADGSLDIKGSLDKPHANGELTLDSCYIKSFQYGINLHLSEKPIRIAGNHVLLEDFKMYATNDSPFTMEGDIDFSDMSNMSMDLRMTARNWQIIDSKENRRSIAFGKAFVDFFATISGPIDDLRMLGRIDVLGSTDMSYILRDSPLSTDNQMDELVKFTNFNDTASAFVTHEPLSGFTMNLTMNIDQGAHIICYLNTDYSNYVDLVGGGSLRMKYDAVNDLQLTGKYTLDNGEMKYSLPVIPLQTFTIGDGSYIEFTGDPMNPRLNVTATERTKATVSSGSGQGRTVEFDCGVVITKTLSDMGLEFILDAPEDMTLHNELQTMSVEQRGKLAVTMLTTGMYLADGNTGSFSMNNALSSFLQSEINNITGNALRTLDLSFGMDNFQNADGNTHTDYSFKFAKRFWNNRLRIVVGGKVSTGAEVENQNESFFDNVTFEYRLGNTTDKYLKLFYDNNAYDWLEGTMREYGVGFVWRRSLQHFKEIFSFKKRSASIPLPAGTIENGEK